MNKTELIGVWQGNNLKAIIARLVNINQEVKIKVNGKKLIIKETRTSFYCCIPVGEPIEIPEYLIDYEQEPDTPVFDTAQNKQELRECCKLSEDDLRSMHQAWGLNYP